MGNVRQTGTQARNDVIFNEYEALLKSGELDRYSSKKKLYDILAERWKYTSAHIARIIHKKLRDKTIHV